MPAPPDTETFEAHRELMFAVAYRMLGTVADAEDALQDAWLRWSAAPRADVTDPRAYLTKIITNTSLNKLRAVRARRESYIGSWLPEPLLTSENPDFPVRLEVAESVSLAMLVVLESLTPEERAVFVLREVFGFGYAEIGAALGRTEASARQLAHRAREHVQARRPRFPVDRGQEREVTQRFLEAAAGGHLDRLIAVLAPDVTLLSDGGGKAKAALRPVTGPAKVARLLIALVTRPKADLSQLAVELTEINGGPGLLFLSPAGTSPWLAGGARSPGPDLNVERVLGSGADLGGAGLGGAGLGGAGLGGAGLGGSGLGGAAVAAVTWEISDGLVTGVQIITNPDKLAALSARRTLPL